MSASRRHSTGHGDKYPTNNAKWLACSTFNASRTMTNTQWILSEPLVTSLSVQWNQRMTSHSIERDMTAHITNELIGYHFCCWYGTSFSDVFMTSLVHIYAVLKPPKKTASLILDCYIRHACTHMPPWVHATGPHARLQTCSWNIYVHDVCKSTRSMQNTSNDISPHQGRLCKHCM